MKEKYLLYPAEYFTSTIYEWKPVLADDNHKDIIIGSLQFLVEKKRIELNAFVIMNNHIHLTCLPQASLATIGNLYTFPNSSLVYEVYRTTIEAFHDDK